MTPTECTGCVPHNLPYLAWHADAEARDGRGEKQIQCPVCGLWRWPDQLKPQGVEPPAPVEAKP